MIGRKIGPYSIDATLGVGGMGEVYAAVDSRLGRRVALKILSGDMAEDFERRERFEREAKAIAAIDHPNIVTIYSIEDHEGLHLLAMQLVEGRTLAEVIPEGGLALEEFLRLAVRLVEAVCAAHEAGVVHRDLKPSNVMVGSDGRLKVLDFGLAKLRGEESKLRYTSSLGTIGLTGEGQIIGTVAYMSPEQAQGLPADSRSDVFSLGVLLYEMATGMLPFMGDTPISIMSSIIKDQPQSVTTHRPVLPYQLGRIVRRCLAKDPLRRFQTAIDLRNALDELKEEIDSGEGEFSVGALPAPEGDAPHTRRSLWRTLGLLAAVAAGVFAGIGLWQLWSHSGDPVERVDAEAPAVPHVMVLPSQAELNDAPAWSPDGSWLAYAANGGGDMDLWMWSPRGGRPEQLTDTPVSEAHPSWSPDGSRIAYSEDSTEGGVFVIGSSEGGQGTQLSAFGARPVWSPNEARNQIAFDWLGSIYLLDLEPGGGTRQVISGTSGVPHAAWSPTGTYLYFWNRTKADVQILAVGEDDAEAESLGLVPAGEDVSGIAVSPTGRYLVLSRGPFGGNKNLWRVPLDPNTGRPSGPASQRTLSHTDDRNPTISAHGRLAFVTRETTRHLFELSLDPETGLARGDPRQLTLTAERNYYPVLSPDDSILAWTAHVTEQGALYYMDATGVETKAHAGWSSSVREVGASFSHDGSELVFTSTEDGDYELWRVACLETCIPIQVSQSSNPTRHVFPAWSPLPEDEVVVYYSNEEGNWDIWLLDMAAGSGSTALTKATSDEMYPVWSPDGRSIAYRTNRDLGQADIWTMGSDGSDPTPLVMHPAEEGWGGWDPSGRRFYFTSNRSGAFNVWVQDAPGDQARQVTHFDEQSRGLPEEALYTKFAVSGSRLIVPIETRRASVWLEPPEGGGVDEGGE